ncbi:MAG: hypothetical protein IKN59_07660 [Paludibacteraceae bacterium]|nr:hypothetical protein [Paludibacteraceae bacterium]
MIHYNINYSRLALALVPIRLRQPLMMNFIYVLLSQVRRLATVFDSFRTTVNYRLTHNSQVCYLRAVLNDRFDMSQRRIEIIDVEPQSSPVLYQRPLSRFLMAPEAGSGNAIMLSKRAFSGNDAVNFAVIVPAVLRGAFPEDQMRALVDTYKLASKRYTITYR